MLKPQDIVVTLKLLNPAKGKLTFAQLAGELGMSASETHQAFYRARESGLISPTEKTAYPKAVEELLIHGLKYTVPVKPGARTRGIITGAGASPLRQHFAISPDDPELLVWPDPYGDSAGAQIEPLTRSAPFAARQDSKLYEWLVLADTLRGAGRARERKLAEQIVRERLGRSQ